MKVSHTLEVQTLTPARETTDLYVYPPKAFKVDVIRVVEGMKDLMFLDMIVDHQSQLMHPVPCTLFHPHAVGQYMELPTLTPARPLVLKIKNPTTKGITFKAKIVGRIPPDY